MDSVILIFWVNFRIGSQNTSGCIVLSLTLVLCIMPGFVTRG